MSVSTRPDLSKTSTKVRDYVENIERELAEARLKIAVMVGENRDTKRFPFGPGYPDRDDPQFPCSSVQCRLPDGTMLNLRVHEDGVLQVSGDGQMTVMPVGSNMIRIRGGR